MINDELYTSLASIFNATNINIRSYRQVFSYGNAVNPLLSSDKDLITYDEESKTVWGKGKEYIEDTVDGYKYFIDTRYRISVRFEFFGANAETLATQLIQVLNNNKDNFTSNSLDVLSYGTIENLTRLENSDFKERFAINVRFAYNLINEIEPAYKVDKAEFTLEQRS